MLRGDGARRSGAEASELVPLDHGNELRPVHGEEGDDEYCAFCESRIRLDARVAELAIRGGHVGKATLGELEPPARRDLDGTDGHPDERRFNGLHGVCWSKQLLHVAFGQVERHTISVPSRTTIRSPSMRTTASQGTALGVCPLGVPIPTCSSRPRCPTTSSVTFGWPGPSSERMSRQLPTPRPYPDPTSP